MVRACFLLCVALAAGACGDSSSSAGTVDPPDELGAFAVGHSTFTAVDGDRDNRSLPVDIWYPVDPEAAAQGVPRQYKLLGDLGPVSEVALADPPVSERRHSLLIFSHGYGGIATQSVGLMEMLASHGFIVASPEHTGNAQSSPDDSFDEAASKRVPDVSFLIDEMIRRSQDPNDPFYERIDEARIGVVGHSFGGMTAIGMAAGWADAPADPRVTAILPVSAVIVPELQSAIRTSPSAGFTQAQLESITVPVMLMGGTEDVDVFPENNEVGFEQIINAPRAYKVDIVGATHTHFASVCWIGNYLISIGLTKDEWPTLGAGELVEPYDNTCGPEALPIEEANRLANLYTVAFFRRHLRDERGYDVYLTAGHAEAEPGANLSQK
jgi:predicted dienelactone hydrolase